MSEKMYGPVPAELVRQHLSGCPFIDFKPCVAEKCFFFTPLAYGGERDGCLIISQYYKVLTMEITSQFEAIQAVALPASERSAPSYLRFAHNAVESLRTLATLQSHPALSPELKAEISEMKSLIRAGLEKFCG